MSLIKFELKNDHVKLVKQLRFTKGKGITINAADEFGSPFGGDNLYEDMDIILSGKPEVNFDPLGEPEPLEMEIITLYQKLYDELPTALEVILNLNTFELGHYKRKHHQRGHWRAYTPKIES